MGAVLSAGPGSEGWPRRHGPAAGPTDCDPTCPDARGRSIGTVSRQAGLLAFGSSRSPNGLPAVGRSAVACAFGVLADHSGGPAPELHRFTFSPAPGGAGNCRPLELGTSEI